MLEQPSHVGGRLLKSFVTLVLKKHPVEIKKKWKERKVNKLFYLFQNLSVFNINRCAMSIKWLLEHEIQYFLPLKYKYYQNWMSNIFWFLILSIKIAIKVLLFKFRFLFFAFFNFEIQQKIFQSKKTLCLLYFSFSIQLQKIKVLYKEVFSRFLYISYFCFAFDIFFNHEFLHHFSSIFVCFHRYC